MPIELTRQALNASAQGAITPQIILEIEGYNDIFGVVDILEPIQYGDEGLTFGDGHVYGEIEVKENTHAYISFKAGTTTSIRQQLSSDKGVGESIQSMRIALVDKDEFVTRTILTPDENTSPAKDVLGRRAKVWLGFSGTTYKDDFFVIFRGNIESIDSKPGVVLFNINHPDSKKKSNIFAEASTELNGAINNSVTSITVNDTSDFLDPSYVGPSGIADSNFEYILRIDDELIKYTGMTGTTFTGLTRGYLNTTAVAHDNETAVNSVYRFKGNAMEISLKLMLSGWGDSFQGSVAVENFVRISGSQTVDNSIFFSGVDLEADYNIEIGDYVTTTGATNGANNVTLKEIIGITSTDIGSYCVVNGVSFVEETESAAIVAFRSQFDTFPDGAKMVPDEVDVSGHLQLRNNFLSDDLHYDFILQESIDLKDFLSEQVYNPLSVYSVPKQARSSVGYHINAVLPTSEIKILDSTNVIDAKGITLTRSTSKNFFNSILYRYDQDYVDPDRYYSAFSAASATSFERINVGVKVLKIDSWGLRTAEGAPSFAQSSATRRLNKFQFGAETLKPVRVNFETGFNLEIGDVVLVDLADLKISDIKSGTRQGESRLFEIINKELDIRTGKITFELLDPNFDKSTRYGLISPSSLIRSGASTTQFIIKQSYNHPYGIDEYRLWINYVGASVVVRNEDYSINDTSIITNIQGNTITVSPALSFTPSANYIMELDSYNNQTEQVKLIYTFMQDNATFDDGEIQYTML